MTRDELITICERMCACEDDGALGWLRAQTCATAAECWAACERGDWMICLLTERHGVVPDRALRLIAVDCARAVQPIADEWFAQHAPQHVGAGVRLLDLIESDPDADPQTWAFAMVIASDAVRAAWDAEWDSTMNADDARAARDAVSHARIAGKRKPARDVAWDVRAASADQARIVRARVEWAEVERGLQEVAR